MSRSATPDDASRAGPRAPSRTPDPVHRIAISHPDLPPEAEGLSILHLADLHAARRRPRFQWLLRVLERTEADLIAFTGDWMAHPGDEDRALALLREAGSTWRTRLGTVGVFGNHDSTAFRRAALEIEAVAWLDAEGADLAELDEHGPDCPPIRLVGTGWPEDWVATAIREPGRNDADAGFRIGLAHHPDCLPSAMHAGIHLLLLGHTHGGQIRLPSGWAPFTNSALPRHAAAGLLRMGETLACVSRGIGDGGMDVRVNCPPHALRIELRRGHLPGGDSSPDLRLIERW